MPVKFSQRRVYTKDSKVKFEIISLDKIIKDLEICSTTDRAKHELGWDLISIDNICPWKDETGKELYVNDLLNINGEIHKCVVSQGEYGVMSTEGQFLSPRSNENKITGNLIGDFYSNSRAFR